MNTQVPPKFAALGIEYYAAIIGLAILVATVTWSIIAPRRRRLRRFAGRDVLTLDEVYSRFFAAKDLPKNLVVELWTEVAKPLGVPAGKLRPTDRFDNELAPIEKWDDDIVEVQWAAERRLTQTGKRVDLSQIKTLGDYVEFFCNLATQRQQA
jgi:hypothetical protein